MRDYAVKQFWGEEGLESKLLAEHCLAFVARCAKIRGTEIAKTMSVGLRRLLDNPESCLP